MKDLSCPVCRNPIIINLSMCIGMDITTKDKNFEVESGPEYSDVMVQAIYCMNGCSIQPEVKKEIKQMIEERLYPHKFLKLANDLQVEL